MLEMVIWDVQHGSAAYIKTPNLRHIAVDLGTGSYGSNGEFSPLLHLKNSRGVGQLDLAVITHPHRDHIDDIFNFDTLSPKALLAPKTLTEGDIRAANRKDDSEKVSKYLEIRQKYNVNAAPTEKLAPPENWGGVIISSFQTGDCPATNINNHSYAVVFEYAQSKILVMGDNEAESWKRLMADARFLTATKNLDVLVTSHHGRESGYYADFFTHTKPKVSIVSDGRFCDTSASSRYSAVSEGWTVWYADGTSETRYCLTTRDNGYVYLRAFVDASGTPILNISAQFKKRALTQSAGR